MEHLTMEGLQVREITKTLNFIFDILIPSIENQENSPSKRYKLLKFLLKQILNDKRIKHDIANGLARHPKYDFQIRFQYDEKTRSYEIVKIDK